MNIEDRVELFSEQIMCGAEIYTWRYDADMKLMHSNCPKEELLDETLNAFGGKNALREYALTGDKPMVLSIPIGLIWCVTADRRPLEERNIYVIGPVWSTDANMSGNYLPMEKISRERGVSMSWLREMAQAQRSLPVVMPTLMYQYALMLHCTVTGEQLGLSDIIHQRSKGNSEPGEPQLRDRYRTWQLEQTMLKMVREGDMGYPKVFNQASSISRGVPVDSAGALRQAKTSVIVFTSLCTRAAIEGGLSPEEAYTLGDGYIASVESCSTVSDVASYSYGMYADFVGRVHNKRVDADVSSHIRAVCDYVELHADEPFTNADLARRAGYSEQYLRRKFAQEMHVSLPDYIRAVRLERAKTMLVNSELSIQEIADHLQFCSRAHFSDVFAKALGLTPAKYREKHRI